MCYINNGFIIIIFIILIQYVPTQMCGLFFSQTDDHFFFYTFFLCVSIPNKSILKHIDHSKKKNNSGFKEGKNLPTQMCRLVDNGYKIEIIFSM